MTTPKNFVLWAALAASLTASIAFSQRSGTPPEPVAKVFQRNCAVSGCHQGKFPAGALNLEADNVIASTVNVASVEKPEFKIIDRDAPDKSYLLKKINGDKDIAGRRMPRGRDALKAADLEVLTSWINSLKTTSLSGDLKNDVRLGFNIFRTF